MARYNNRATEITLKRDDVCFDTGIALPAGTKARYFYAQGKMRVACLKRRNEDGTFSPILPDGSIGGQVIQPQQKATPQGVAKPPKKAQGAFKATRHARELAQTLGVDLNNVQPSKENGVISKADVQNHHDARNTPVPTTTPDPLEQIKNDIVNNPEVLNKVAKMFLMAFQNNS